MVDQVVQEDVTTTIAEAGPPRTVKTGDSMTEQAFNAFVEARSTPLLRTAHLLTRDQGLAEDLLQTALAKAWFSWGRIEGQPEAYVRRILVNTYATWWRRKWNGEEATSELPREIAAVWRTGLAGRLQVALGPRDRGPDHRVLDERRRLTHAPAAVDSARRVSRGTRGPRPSPRTSHAGFPGELGGAGRPRP